MKKLTTVLIIGFLVSGCANMPLSEQVGGGLGALIGGIGGEKLAKQLGLQDSTLRSALIAGGAGAGAAVGVVIGGKIAQYLSERDKQNIVTVLNDTKNNQPVAWCSDKNAPASRDATLSRNVGSVQCGNANKIIATPGVAAKNDQGETCRSSKTEVAMPNGQIETVTQNLCLAKDGGWYEKAA
jgi:hypothetical protein